MTYSVVKSLSLVFNSSLGFMKSISPILQYHQCFDKSIVNIISIGLIPFDKSKFHHRGHAQTQRPCWRALGPRPLLTRVASRFPGRSQESKPGVDGDISSDISAFSGIPARCFWTSLGCGLCNWKWDEG